MKIAHVVSYVSKDGAFGGPVAVALAQCAELSRNGDTVDLIAGWDGQQKLNVQGVTPKLFPVMNLLGSRLTGLISLRLLAHIWRRRADYDVIHIHLGRDLITSLAAQVAMFARTPFMIQTHGMVMPDQRKLIRLFDVLLTRRVLAASIRVLTLSPAESRGIAAVSQGRANMEMTTNGLAIRNEGRRASAAVIPKVVFLARLHPRKRVLRFAEAAVSLLSDGVNAEFQIFGPDEGDLSALQHFISKSGCEGLSYMGAISPGSGPSVLGDARVYVLPSFGEVVPMSVLESMSVGTPVVITNDCAMAEKLAASHAAIVTDGSVAELAKAIRSLVDDPELHALISTNAFTLIQNFYNISTVTAAIRDLYPSK